jgi:hypothetical protein
MVKKDATGCLGPIGSSESQKEERKIRASDYFNNPFIRLPRTC